MHDRIRAARSTLMGTAETQSTSIVWPKKPANICRYSPYIGTTSFEMATDRSDNAGEQRNANYEQPPLSRGFLRIPVIGVDRLTVENEESSVQPKFKH